MDSPSDHVVQSGKTEAIKESTLDAGATSEEDPIKFHGIKHEDEAVSDSQTRSTEEPAKTLDHDVAPSQGIVKQYSDNDRANDDSVKVAQSLNEPNSEQTDLTLDGSKAGVESCESTDDKLSDDNDGEPIPSGTGVVSKECSASELLGWSEILPRWHNNLKHRPKGLDELVKKGVPQPLRGEVWQLLSGAHECAELMDQYRILLTKSGPAEQIILRDVHRTYPAHENFRSGAGSSSLVDSLFKVCKAYAVHDEEVGYCQGLSFLVAALLLHMPEEQAFCVFVRIMQHYGLRDMFRNNFNELYLKFYQLERLIEDHMPDLYQHFKAINIEPFQYASQWFLTVFTAKFPLNAVFYIMDIFLLTGIETIFRISLALLSASKQELMALDFEGILKFFRVQMPKHYRNQEHVQQLIALSSEISTKKLKNYAKSYELIKRKERVLENPAMKRENVKLIESIVRLESENDNLARDLIESKIQLRNQLDLLEDRSEHLYREVVSSRQTYMNTISEVEDERDRLGVEVSQLKEVCRRELQRAESELSRNSKIIDDYKKICSQLSKRLDLDKRCLEHFVDSSLDLLRDNELCPERTCLELFKKKSDDFLEKLKSAQVGELEFATSSCDSPAPERQSLLQRKVSCESDPTKRPIGAYLKSESCSSSSEVKIEQLTEHINELEVELARTKLALVESECEKQQLAHNKLTPSSGEKSSISSLANKFDFMRSAMTSASPSNSRKEVSMGNPRGALSRINNLISGTISNIGQGQHQQTPALRAMSTSISTPSFADTTSAKTSDIPVTDNGDNKRNVTNQKNPLIARLPPPIAEGEHPC